VIDNCYMQRPASLGLGGRTQSYDTDNNQYDTQTIIQPTAKPPLPFFGRKKDTQVEQFISDIHYMKQKQQADTNADNVNDTR
jgi:hypothetical protein